ncbi:MAG: glycosyltransferase family protein [Candidatus Omnitrophota bacterium]
MKIGVIVQARMGSTRLPGKVLKHILGKPMLWYLIERLKKSQFSFEIIIATTAKKADLPILKLAAGCKVKTFIGSENDVLDRYYQAAKKNKLDVVVRICSDCPFLSARIVDRVIRYYFKHKKTLDYVSNFLIPSYPVGLGVEVFTMQALQRCWKAADKAYQREHVTAYIYEHPDLFRLGNVKYSRDLSGLRLTVDTRQDLQFTRQVYKRLYKKINNFSIENISNLLEKELWIHRINKDVKQKGLRDN